MSVSLALTLAGSPTAALAMAQPAAEAPATESEAPAEAETEMREDPQLSRAMESYELGTQAYNAARYEDALGHFQEAATLYASPDFQYNIGLCYERLGKPEEAVRAYKTYLRAKPNAPDRANVEDRIFTLEKQLAEESGEAGPAPEPAPQPDPEPEPVDTTKGRGLIIGGAALTGLGAAIALGGGLGFGVAASSRSDDLDAIQTGGNPNDSTFADAEALDDEGRRFETLQIVTAAAGAAVAIGGVAMLAIGLKRRKNARSGSQAVLVPTFTGRSAGFSLQGRF
ncbi:MAG: tetratricopeptide repeat protein [Myxococcota bacterium]